MSPIDYGWKQLYTSVGALAGNGSLKERLCNALQSLAHITPERDIPESLRQDFGAFWTKMNSRPASGDEGTIQATVETLGEIELSDAADKIISFYTEVCRQQGASRA
ncbi:MAG: hypothetical protein NTX53_03480 [candidate division WOR-3 bacterium]|nr:hypothetical protein [candidate division WOR-3 bacterium]